RVHKGCRALEHGVEGDRGIRNRLLLQQRTQAHYHVMRAQSIAPDIDQNFAQFGVARIPALHHEICRIYVAQNGA
ncbi:hypothetical protein, partial [Pandoraea pneumonica]|uniref:hypothetical protein n=1 Tax=Pandoraea pneumonica TaxID=2508299 RepID=UPI003CF0C32E